MKFRQRCTLWGAVLLVSPALAAAQNHPITGQITHHYTAADTPLQMPTDVAVAPAGQVYVSDGVNHRVAIFSSTGDTLGTITTAGQQPLIAPTGLDVDTAGHLWLADAGRMQILVYSPDVQLERIIDLAQLSAAPIDATDIAVDTDRSRLWIVDNDGQRLLRLALDGGPLASFGRSGIGLIEFDHPFMLSVAAATGNVVISDVLNGRIVLRNADGLAVRTLGSYGARLGQLYRPKGVTFDHHQRIWVSDSDLGVIQAFATDGELLGVLRDEHGTPLHFAHPMGLAFGPSDELYVVELAANRVTRVTLNINPTIRAPRPPRTTLAGAQPRACTLCHFEWLPPLDEGRPTELTDVPPDSPEQPYASRSEVCLSCHDTSVEDSRRRVWVEHGHRVGVQPPADMHIPDRLPLHDGALSCRTCHSAHARGSSGQALCAAVFLRVSESPTQLCTACHAGYTQGTAAGMHPVGENLPLACPDQKSATAASATNVDCLTCHTGHGAQQTLLLQRGIADNALCLSCHTDLQPAPLAADEPPNHSSRPILNETQRTIAHEFNTDVGTQGQLLCVTCHRSHSAPVARALLAFDPAQRDYCGACHPDQQAVVGTTHDLRRSAPDAINVAGLTPAQGGACSACHTAHRPGQEPLVTTQDQRGQCTSCHTAGRLAASHALTDVNHTAVGCIKCHDPHVADRPDYLAAQPSDLCRSCHGEYAALLTGPHDLTRAPNDWPAAATQTADPCLACHRVHGDAQAGLARIAGPHDTPTAGVTCAACHADATSDATGPRTLRHPLTVAGDHPLNTDLPTVTTAGVQQLMCRTCHDPHGRPNTLALLRGQTPQDLCLTCHPDQRNIGVAGHARDVLATAGLQSSACRPCHSVHGAPDAVQAEYLWSCNLLGTATTPDTAPVNQPVPISDQYCQGCHTSGGPAPTVNAVHPIVEMYNAVEPGTPGFLPLFDGHGVVSSQGMIRCRTCHLSHGREQPLPVRAGVENMDGRERRARQWHLRALGEDNVCSHCHGFEALRRFMFFHDPEQRHGPIEDG